MTRQDWAAIYRALFTILIRIPGAVPDDVAKRYENQVFADDALTRDPDLVMVDFLNDVLAQRPELGPVPLLKVPGKATSVDQALRKYLQATPTGVGP